MDKDKSKDKDGKKDNDDSKTPLREYASPACYMSEFEEDEKNFEEDERNDEG